MRCITNTDSFLHGVPVSRNRDTYVVNAPESDAMAYIKEEDFAEMLQLGHAMEEIDDETQTVIRRIFCCNTRLADDEVLWLVPEEANSKTHYEFLVLTHNFWQKDGVVFVFQKGAKIVLSRTEPLSKKEHCLIRLCRGSGLVTHSKEKTDFSKECSDGVHHIDTPLYAFEDGCFRFDLNRH